MKNDFLNNRVGQILTSDRWKQANQKLLAKMIAEFTYEEMIFPEEQQAGEWLLSISKDVNYRFSGQSRLMDSLYVNPTSIERWDGAEWKAAGDAIQFIHDIQKVLKMDPSTIAYLIKEYKHTLLADVHILEKKEHKTAKDLLRMAYSEIEAEMEGHPWITYNKGRIGFSYRDYIEYAPEQQRMTKLHWIAVHKTFATFHSVPGISHDDLLKMELEEECYKRFKDVLLDQDVHASDYFFMPVHLWQWEEVIVPFYAEEIATKNLIYLGPGEDLYLPQQSVRTFINQEYKNKHHVKVPISILNTLVFRGLPSERTVLAPEITQFIQEIRDGDSFLSNECKVVLPGEIASVNVNHPDYVNLEASPYQFLEMLGVIWRESIYQFLDDDESPITLAALLYEDQHERPYILELIKESGLTVEKWVEQLFEVILPPLLHFLYQYGTVFSPHGQNTVLILKDNRPHRLAVKDFVDDVNISDQSIPGLDKLSKDMKNVLRSEAPEGLCQFIFTGLFVCHNRYLADILDRKANLSEYRFWEIVSETILRYQKRFPHLQDRFELFDMFRPTFTKLCLNRNRMLAYGYKNGDDRPHASEYGKVRNPLYEVAKGHIKM
ncbi:Siderophore synthetase component [Lentibacillus persicus]|uniref:Siderophore synthetase component n=1 Tax=Lentibacillus persicus TaxID=640948 RepID=A0A1I2AVA1_9BACI|nr:IucA/IucC family siderophore biosynthesis protein [Lentibacillus persicus]SFE47935.1 Siderophore synthetase component [Lentibacillus persicus]